MRKLKLTIGVFLFALVNSAMGAAPTTMNYQDHYGSTLNGSYTVVFRLYETTLGGTAVWEETQQVAFVNGAFNVNLGSLVPFTSAIFSNQLYLGITVASNPETPRRPLFSSPYAFKSGDATLVNGLEPMTPTNYPIYAITNPYCVDVGIGSFQSTCKTRSCDDTGFGIYYYFNCAGSCIRNKMQGTFSCPNTVLGTVGRPTKPQWRSSDFTSGW